MPLSVFIKATHLQAINSPRSPLIRAFEENAARRDRILSPTPRKGRRRGGRRHREKESEENDSRHGSFSGELKLELIDNFPKSDAGKDRSFKGSRCLLDATNETRNERQRPTHRCCSCSSAFLHSRVHSCELLVRRLRKCKRNHDERSAEHERTKVSGIF